MEPSDSDVLVQIAYASDLVRETSLALRLTQRVTATAQLLLQRYYAQLSITEQTAVWIAGAAILISSKLSNEPRHLRDIANVLHDRLMEREGVAEKVTINKKQVRQPLEFYGAEGYHWKLALLDAERTVMIALGFRLTVELPHKFVLVFLNTLRETAGAPNWTETGVEVFKDILQSAWNYANDLLLSPLCVQEEPEVLAVACIQRALSECEVNLPTRWQTAFGCSAETSERVVTEIGKVYNLLPLRGRYVDYSRCHVFEQFSPLKERVVEREERGQEKSKSKWGQRKRRRFEDAVV